MDDADLVLEALSLMGNDRWVCVGGGHYLCTETFAYKQGDQLCMVSKGTIRHLAVVARMERNFAASCHWLTGKIYEQKRR